MAATELARSRDVIHSYVREQMPERVVMHLERVGVDQVAGQRHETWDVHLDDGARWWVVTNPTNYYPQADFKSRDVVLTFHLGLAIRILTRHQVPIGLDARAIFEPVWRRWDQAIETLGSAEEAEHFQAVGTHLRETLVSLAHELADDALVPAGSEPPKAADVVGWVELFVRALTPGRSNARLREYVTSLIQPTWDYQQHLVHGRNATRMDAEIGAAAVEHLVATITGVVLRARTPSLRCARCDAYGVAGGVCRHCGWQDPDYAPPEIPKRSEQEIAAALAEPCTPSSDVVTMLTVDALIERSTEVTPRHRAKQPRRGS
jgi:hypothetical protein